MFVDGWDTYFIVTLLLNFNLVKWGWCCCHGYNIIFYDHRTYNSTKYYKINLPTLKDCNFQVKKILEKSFNFSSKIHFYNSLCLFWNHCQTLIFEENDKRYYNESEEKFYPPLFNQTLKNKGFRTSTKLDAI